MKEEEEERVEERGKRLKLRTGEDEIKKLPKAKRKRGKRKKKKSLALLLRGR